MIAAAAAGIVAAPALAQGSSIDAAASRISAAIGKCWFAKGESAFADYVYSPEINALAGPPRILLIDKTAPHGRPALVIEFSEAERKIDIYGPLTDTPRIARIKADIDRWAGGSENCS
jgi:hypothetical protein